jgi:hypothetical protein
VFSFSPHGYIITHFPGWLSLRNFDGTQAGREGLRKQRGKKGVLKEIKAECPAKERITIQ